MISGCLVAAEQHPPTPRDPPLKAAPASTNAHPGGPHEPGEGIGRTNLQPAGVPEKGGPQPPRWTRDQVVNVEERSPAQLDMLAAATCARRRLRQRR